MNDVVIVGGGFAGLLTAAELVRRGVDVTVVEQAPSVGGVAGTVRDGGYLFEPAAGSLLLPHPQLSPMLAAAGVEVIPAGDGAGSKLVHTERGLVAVPSSPLAAVRSPLVSPGGKLRAALEPFVRRRPEGDESLEATLRRRLGAEVGGFASTLMAHGIVAGDPENLSTGALFPALVDLERSAGSFTRGMVHRKRSRPRGAPRVRPRPHVHRDGMAGLALALAAHLGDRVRTHWDVKEVRREGDRWLVRGPEELAAGHVVLAVAPAVAAGMVDPDLASALEGPRQAPVAVVGLGGPADALPLPPAFGFLTAPGSPLRVLGVVFESNLAAGRAPGGHHLARAIYGGDADPDVLRLDDDELVALCRRELGQALGRSISPTWRHVHRVEPGIPQYAVGHRAWLAAVDAALAGAPGLHLGGWSYRGVGLSGLAQDAARIADRIAAT